MSCNGCRVLRKGCGDNCILRPCLQWIDTPEAQGHATIFLSKFFGRAGLMSFISAVPESQRPSLFQSLLFEAAGRTVNPVNGAVGLLWTGNWHVCQESVETVLRGGALRPNFELIDGFPTMAKLGDSAEIKDPVINQRLKVLKRRRRVCESDFDLNQSLPAIKSLPEKRRLESPSMNSDNSSMTTSGLREYNYSEEGRDLNLLNLFK